MAEPDDARFDAARAALTERLSAAAIGDARTREAIGRVPRHRFVPAPLEAHAYEDRALPIGEGQTISQPTMVALMTALLAPRPDESVLEIGTGSGYQTAVLAEMAGTVYSVERHAGLAAAAGARLAALGYRNVRTRAGDGRLGWPEAAPFPAVVITAATPEMPPDLWAQLGEGGRIVAPIGTGRRCVLVRVDKVGGEPRESRFGPCSFVPLLPGEARGPGE